MSNPSIVAAFERMWQYIVAALSNKSDTTHTHDAIYEINAGKPQQFWRGTKEEFDAIEVKDDNVMYITVDDGGPAITSNAMKAEIYDPQGKATDIFAYVDTEIAELINSAPTTLDTLGEIATAMAENEDVVEALTEAVGKRYTKDETDAAIAAAIETAFAGIARAENISF